MEFVDSMHLNVVYNSQRHLFAGSYFRNTTINFLIKTFFIALLFANCSATAAQTESGLNKEYLSGYYSHTKSIITAPARWDGHAWKKATLIAGTTAGLYLLDQEIQVWVQDHRNTRVDDVSRFAEKFGAGKYVLPPLGVLYLLSKVQGATRLKRAALLSFESYAVSGLFTNSIKFSLHRHRPDSGDPYDTFDGPSFKTSHLAFSSGHSQTAFAIATVFANEYKNIRVVPVIAYGAATMAALSRVNDNIHWSSDIFFGSMLGYMTAKKILHLQAGKGAGNLSFSPSIRDDVSGLQMAYTF